MRFTSRRDMLKIIGSFASLPVVMSLPEFAKAGKTSTASKNNDKNNQKYLTDFHRWYCETHFNFDKAMNAKERSFLKACIDGQAQWWKNIDTNVALSTMTYSHRINGTKINSSRIGYGSFGDKNDSIQKLGREICKVRGINLADFNDQGNSLGLGWDFEEDLFKIYLFEENMSQVNSAPIKKLLKDVEKYSSHTFGLRSYSFKNSKLLETRAYVALKSKEQFDLISKDSKVNAFQNQIRHINLMVSDSRGIVPQYDLAEPIDYKVFNAQGQKLVAEYKKKFGSHPDTLAYNNQNEFVLYYP